MYQKEHSLLHCPGYGGNVTLPFQGLGHGGTENLLYSGTHKATNLHLHILLDVQHHFIVTAPGHQLNNIVCRVLGNASWRQSLMKWLKTWGKTSQPFGTHTYWHKNLWESRKEDTWISLLQGTMVLEENCLISILCHINNCIKMKFTWLDIMMDPRRTDRQ